MAAKNVLGKAALGMAEPTNLLLIWKQSLRETSLLETTITKDCVLRSCVKQKIVNMGQMARKFLSSRRQCKKASKNNVSRVDCRKAL